MGAAPAVAQVAPGHRLVGAISETETHLVDSTGAVIHTWVSDFKPGVAAYLKEDGRLVRTINTVDGEPGSGGGVQEILPDGTVVWDFRYDTDGVLSHHDIELLPNGNVLLVAWEEITEEAAIAAGRDPSRTRGPVLPDQVVEVQPTGPTSGTIVWKWRAWDHMIQDFDPERTNFGDVKAHPELIDVNYPPERTGGELQHVNSIDYDPENDWILLSACYQDEIWIIDHGTTIEEAAGHGGGRWGKGGDLIYRWGNPAAHRAGTSADRRLFNPHSAQFVPRGCPGAGNVTVFSNKALPRSEVLELRLPKDEAPAEVVWRYAAVGFDSDLMASAERLPNGNTLICSSLQLRLFEIDAEGQVVWELGKDRLTGYPFHATYVEPTRWNALRRLRDRAR